MAKGSLEFHASIIPLYATHGVEVNPTIKLDQPLI